MEFNGTKPIYLQLADRIMDRVIRGETAEGSRLPSVRDYAAETGVNPNTILRTYTWLQDNGIVYNRRCVGYFIADGARATITIQRQEEFIGKELPEFVSRMIQMGISPSRFIEVYNQILKNNN